MPTVRLEQLREGMELAEDVLDRNGLPLARSGAVLSSSDLRRFRMWGVTEIEVTSQGKGGDEPAPAIDPELLERYKPELLEIFKRANLDHPFMAQLFQESLMRYVKQRVEEKR